MAHIGVLQRFEDHRIPIDFIAVVGGQQKRIAVLRVVLHLLQTRSYIALRGSSPCTKQRMDEETQDYRPEIYSKTQSKSSCVHGMGEYLLGEEQI